MTRPLATQDVSAAQAAPETRSAAPPPGVALAGLVGNRAMTRALTVQRDPLTDVRTMSITPQFAQGLPENELAEQLRSLGQHILSLPQNGPEYQAARENQAILQREQVRRLVEGPGTSSGGDTVEARHARFKQAVLLSAQHRLTENQQNLEQWRAVIEAQMSPEALQAHVLAQSAADLRQTAERTSGMPAYDAWAGDPNPFRRNVYEHQARGEWRACTGCHEMVRADELSRHEDHMGPNWTSPADRLSGFAGLPQGDGAETARVQAAIDAIRPVVAPLGDSGYRIIPDDVFSLRGGLTPEQLRETIFGRIAIRRANYAELSARIADGDVDYLQLGPILQDLLPTADAEVQAAVRDDQDDEHAWSIVMIGGTLILSLLSLVFPPLALALAAIQFASGYQQFQQGSTYQLGVGANNVFTRDQQDAAGGMMASGVLNMGMAAATIAAVGPGVMDMAATRAITAADVQIAQRIAQRALAGPVAEAELLQLQQPGLVGRMAHGWAEMRGFQVVYRGQGAPTAEILSPAARAGGVDSSRALYDSMRAQGLTDLEIAGYTARWNDQPVPAFDAPPGMADQPLGSVGIPTTRLPNVASDFAQTPTGVIYVLRVPRGQGVPVGQAGWGMQSAIEQEIVFFHQLPNGMVVRTMSPTVAPPLRFDSPPGVGPSLTVPPAP
ncbi:hypothetical protein [Kibdelosporangium aridum]|uniref:Uncharacterized protein n=1 Tax=Kibdelosporangium aridum TaxID=2030 RepID=A0A1W2BA35_KIBAR|nr:hypothetical protein [Kibdelosporangium aridum]SMC69883.1 hypothetical protein SAMN05661093_01517 [Kibdelosporangium aridum]